MVIKAAEQTEEIRSDGKDSSSEQQLRLRGMVQHPQKSAVGIQATDAKLLRAGRIPEVSLLWAAGPHSSVLGSLGSGTTTASIPRTACLTFSCLSFPFYQKEIIIY